MEHTFWTWNWISGGYNSCPISVAPTLREAKRRSAELGCGRIFADPKTFRKITTAEMAALDRAWAAAFD